jgi:hypothetical protein
MDTKKMNDIEVKDFTDVTLQSFTAETLNAIEDAKKLLEGHGYFVDNLWQTCDVMLNYECTEAQAQEVLNGAFSNDATYQQIWEAIGYQAESMNLKRRD